jgi:hypothetical protein
MNTLRIVKLNNIDPMLTQALVKYSDISSNDNLATIFLTESSIAPFLIATEKVDWNDVVNMDKLEDVVVVKTKVPGDAGPGLFDVKGSKLFIMHFKKEISDDADKLRISLLAAISKALFDITGVQLEFVNNDLKINGKKFSGSVFETGENYSTVITSLIFKQNKKMMDRVFNINSKKMLAKNIKINGISDLMLGLEDEYPIINSTQMTDMILENLAKRYNLNIIFNSLSAEETEWMSDYIKNFNN